MPFAIDPVASNNIYAASESGLYRSQNRGDTWSSRVNGTPTDGRPTSISVSPANNNRVWVGTSIGWVYLFDFGANQVTRLGDTLPGRYISKILASPNNANTVYATYSGYNANTPSTPGKVFRSTNLGQNWTNISGNLPDVPVSALAINPADENEMWVGTDIGVYVTTDGGATWTSYRGNMPVVAIMDLKYNAATGYLTVATHGRGVWRLQPHAAAATHFIRLPFVARGSVNSPPPTATQPGTVPSATPTRTATTPPGGPTATPTRTPTATATTGGATATPTRTPTATATTGGVPSVINGSFESGSGVGWTIGSTNAFPIIRNSGLPITARSGSWIAWLGGGHDETSVISQTVTLPASPALYLTFYYQLLSEESGCIWDLGYVYVNAALQATAELCISNNVTSWAPHSIDLSAFAGQTVTLSFWAVTDGSLLSSFFVDDVALATAPIQLQAGAESAFQPPDSGSP